MDEEGLLDDEVSNHCAPKGRGAGILGNFLFCYPCA